MPEWNQETAKHLIEQAHGQEKPVTTALRLLQDYFRHIDARAIPLLAAIYNLGPAEVHGIISFYADFTTSPPGRRIIRLCRAEACQAVGADELAAHAQKHLGVKMGKTSADGGVTLEAVYCLGLCANGPAGQIDGELAVHLDPEKLEKLIAGPPEEDAP